MRQSQRTGRHRQTEQPTAHHACRQAPRDARFTALGRADGAPQAVADDSNGQNRTGEINNSAAGRAKQFSEGEQESERNEVTENENRAIA